MSIHSIIEGDRRYRDEEKFASAGFTKQELVDGELVDAPETLEEEEEFAPGLMEEDDFADEQ